MERKFIGRSSELEQLERLAKKNIASMVVMRGRRRVGKSRLIEEFAKNSRFIKFSGLPPEEGISANEQREHFANQCSEQLTAPKPDPSNWNNLLFHLARETENDKVIILLDEISWMAEGDSTFLGKLKTYWDDHFKKNPNLILFLCGSVSSWIEENIIKSTGFVGRMSLTMTLKELPMYEAVEFWGNRKNKISDYEKFKLLSITGGIPRYLEEIILSESAEENIRHLCFEPQSLLLKEFDHIFYDAFSRKSKYYREIIELLAIGPRDIKSITQALQIPSNGRLTEILNELTLAGFIQRDFTWNLKSQKDSSLSQYRLSDNYLRFYCHYLAPQSAKIERGDYHYKSISALPNWSIMAGLQFENLVLNNRQMILAACGIKYDDLINHGPYFQRKTTRIRGCQIDYLIQTRYNTLYIIEIKFSKDAIGCSVIEEVEKKLACINDNKRFSIRPVLVHVNGITEELINTDYFDAIIDFGQLLNN